MNIKKKSVVEIDLKALLLMKSRSRGHRIQGKNQPEPSEFKQN